MFQISYYTLFPLYEFYSSEIFSHKVFNEVMLTHSKCHIIYFFSQSFFEDNIYDILISNQTVFRLCLWEYLKGLLTLELYIYIYIYHGISPYFFHWVLKSFTWYIGILWFFSQGFPNLQDDDWWANKDVYGEPID